jgi:hypothetical protein
MKATQVPVLGPSLVATAAVLEGLADGAAEVAVPVCPVAVELAATGTLAAAGAAVALVLQPPQSQAAMIRTRPGTAAATVNRFGRRMAASPLWIGLWGGLNRAVMREFRRKHNLI